MNRGAIVRCADAKAIALAAVRAAAAGDAVRRAIEPSGDGLRLPTVRPVACWRGSGRLIVCALGKAAAAMLEAASAVSGGRVSGSYALVPHGYPLPCRATLCEQARHPGPGTDAVAATRRLLAAIGTTRADDLVIVLLSGGASAVLEEPREGVDAAEIGRLVARLQAAGASVHEVNRVRRALSRIKGGGLARRLRPATVWTLAVSDVPDDDPAAIGSGPTVLDRPVERAARAVLEHYGLAEDSSDAVRAALARTRREPTAPDPRDRFVIVASRATALAGARRRAEALGYRVEVLSAPVCGEAREAAVRLLRRARRAAGNRARFCLVAGGETTVTVVGPGRGGRNQEMALAAALELDGSGGVCFCSLGTDGIDGDTDAAGACVDGGTVAAHAGGRAAAERALAENDSHAFLGRVGALLRTGPTGTNVMDVQVVTVERSDP